MVNLIQYSEFCSGRVGWAGFHAFVCPITCLNCIKKLADSNRWMHSKFVFSTCSFQLAGNGADSAFA
jgi:hypothetical protein